MKQLKAPITGFKHLLSSKKRYLKSPKILQRAVIQLTKLIKLTKYGMHVYN